jgi:hypothetical protein
VWICAGRLVKPQADQAEERSDAGAVCEYFRLQPVITVYVDPKRGLNTSGRAASLDEAKAQFLSIWQRCRVDSTPFGQRST